MSFIKNIFSKLNDFVHRHKEGVPFLMYTVIYLTWFSLLEINVIVPRYLIHLPMDNRIPFIPQFIIPYELWFPYVLVTVLYLLFTAKDEYWRVFTFLVTGMTLFLIISTLWPNGQNLRPNLIGNEGFFENWVMLLYRTDTPTNIWPSIHVYNSLGIEFAVARSEKLRKYRLLRACSFVLCILIILSTMFLKQHSVFDVGTAIILAVLMYYLVYYLDIIQMIKTAREKRQAKKEYVRKQ
ncbi:MAG: phosphatase PAP2 family protein [Lachnospiraceae bacterium]|nr:phosphatase PAP2 family protein [Lachnospiraceae bacterium]